MITTRTPQNACRCCGYLVDAASGVDHNARAKPGDVSLCMKCGEASVFTGELVMRPPTAEELATIEADPMVRRARRAICDMWVAEARKS